MDLKPGSFGITWTNRTADGNVSTSRSAHVRGIRPKPSLEKPFKPFFSTSMQRPHGPSWKYQALALFSTNTPKKRCRAGIQLASRMSQTSRRIFDRSGPIIPWTGSSRCRLNNGFGHSSWLRKEQQFQADLKRVIGQVLDTATATPPILTHAMQVRLASLAEIIALGRTHVYRSSFGNREIEHVPEPEANTRIAKGLAALAKGVASLHGQTQVAEEDLQDIFRVGLDSLQDYRRRLFLAVAKGTNPGSVNMPHTMRQRELEELEELGLLEKAKPDSGYRLTDRIARLWNRVNVK